MDDDRRRDIYEATSPRAWGQMTHRQARRYRKKKNRAHGIDVRKNNWSVLIPPDPAALDDEPAF